ncbi:sulfite exporter TauE/SafE family protein [Nocardioides caldifontis]|uniref:sulfite exporter TauE/SafE family protein n=1 Tax=Nocardioides caldifontis TaxID=2588938 RepID=UPI0011DFE6AC|nr:sulfite exporter TauE/SafE family protein [Nocardioides caldifontis]
MTVWELVAVAFAGGAAGFINAVAGSGTLVTFPTLLAFGVPPVTANVSNNIGLVPGSVSGAIGWRRELRGQRARTIRLASASAVGGTIGAVLLLVLPEDAFSAIVPALIGLGVVLVALGPRINRRVAAAASGDEPPADRWWLWPATSAAGVYGGYFGAAQGIILIAVLGLGTHDTVHRNNALKNVLSGIVNGIAAVVFIIVVAGGWTDAEIDWVLVGLIAFGSIVGAQVGARVGRRMPAALMRGFIIVVGLTALVVFLVR